MHTHTHTHSHTQRQELPEQWNNVKKQAVLAKQAVAPLQATEVGIIRRKLASFDVRISITAAFIPSGSKCSFLSMCYPPVDVSVWCN